jgi:hypothetical protein
VIALATLIGAWMFRFENVHEGKLHRNRITGAICMVQQECWLHSLF